MVILVTGTAGFIGFHTAQALLAKGHEVVGIDNFNDYYRVQLKRDRHAILAGRPGYTGIEGDLCDYGLLQRLFKEHRFERVCHLAAQPGVRYSLQNPFAYQKSNLEAFLNVLEACRHGGVKRLVYASSSSVYGGNRKMPFSEADRVDAPISLYAATKKANELMAHTYTHLFDFQTVGLRFFTVYGPWGRPDMAVWLFTEAMVKGKTIPVFNHGNLYRDFTYVDDIVSGVEAALFAPHLQRDEVINLGNHCPEKVTELIRLIGRELGIEPKIEYRPMQPGEVEKTYADIEQARRKLGFQPRTSLAEGIPRFVAWYRQYHKL